MTRPDRHRERRTAAAVAAVIAIALAAGCRAPLSVKTAAAGDDGGGQGASTREWTIAVYMAADNELEAAALSDLNEMEAAVTPGDLVTTVVLLDRTPGFSAAAGDWTDTRLFEVQPDPLGEAARIVSTRLRSERLGVEADATSELDTANPQTLAAFLAFARERYPAEHSALILWGAGSGYRAVSIDESSGGDALRTGELPDALEHTPPATVGLDLNFGAQLEIAVELAPFSQTLVASQETVGSAGWDYRALLEELAADPGGEGAFARAAVDAFSAVYAGSPGACISTVDLGRSAAVSDALDVVSDHLYGVSGTAATREELRERLFSEVEDFYRTPGDLNLDLGDLAVTVAAHYPGIATAASELLMTVGGAVRRSWCAPGANTEATGLSVHFVPVDTGGFAYPPHADEYVAGRVVGAPLRFVSDSQWVPDELDAGGLLYRLWYEAM